MKIYFYILSAVLFFLSSNYAYADMLTKNVTKSSQEKDHIERFSVQTQPEAGFVNVDIVIPKKYRTGLYLVRLDFGDKEKTELSVSIAPQEKENGEVHYTFEILPSLASKNHVSLFFKDTSINGTIYVIDVESYINPIK